MGLQAVPMWIPLDTDGITQIQHPAEVLRALTRAISTFPGVGTGPSSASATNAGGDFAATVVPAAMQLTIAKGHAFIPGREGSSSLQQMGSYFAYSDASETISWPANASGSSRMDSLILRVADPQYGSIGGNPLGAWWQAVAGSSGSARPDSDFLSGGSQYIPGAWLRMYDVLVPNGATQLTQSNVAFKGGYSNVHGFWPYFSSGPPSVSPLSYGQRGFEIDTGTHTWWNGSTWHSFPPMSPIAVCYFTGGTAATSSGATEAAVAAWTNSNSATLLNAHSYMIHVSGGAFSSASSTTEQVSIAIRTAVNSTGAQKVGDCRVNVFQAGASVSSFETIKFVKNATGANLTKTFGLTVKRLTGSGNGSLYGDTSTPLPLVLAVYDLGLSSETQLGNVAVAVT